MCFITVYIDATIIWVRATCTVAGISTNCQPFVIPVIGTDPVFCLYVFSRYFKRELIRTLFGPASAPVILRGGVMLRSIRVHDPLLNFKRKPLVSKGIFTRDQ